MKRSDIIEAYERNVARDRYAIVSKNLEDADGQLVRCGEDRGAGPRLSEISRTRGATEGNGVFAFKPRDPGVLAPDFCNGAAEAREASRSADYCVNAAHEQHLSMARAGEVQPRQITAHGVVAEEFGNRRTRHVLIEHDNPSAAIDRLGQRAVGAASLKDVARAAGVSVTTVSRFLNGSLY